MSKTLNKEMKTIVSRFLCNPGARAAHSGGDLKVQVLSRELLKFLGFVVFVASRPCRLLAPLSDDEDDDDDGTENSAVSHVTDAAHLRLRSQLSTMTRSPIGARLHS